MHRCLERRLEGRRHRRGQLRVRDEPLQRLPPTETLEVPASKIGSLLGYRGETITRIQEWSGATVSVPREGELRTVVICAPSQASVDAAKSEVDEVLRTSPQRQGARKADLPRGQGNVQRASKLWHR